MFQPRAVVGWRSCGSLCTHPTLQVQESPDSNTQGGGGEGTEAKLDEGAIG